MHPLQPAKFKFSALAVLAGFCLFAPGAVRAEPIANANSTILGPNVYVFNTNMPGADIQSVADKIFHQMESNQFAPQGYALLFKTGTYPVRFYVGFYTHVAGLGQNPDDVQIDGALTINAKWADGMALDNFWRTVENLAIIPSADVPWQYKKGMTRIAVSQAAPLRRLHVKGELQLFDWGSKGNVGYASGGFLADSIVDGKVVPASQQQWLSRNSKWGTWGNAVWNMVFVGCENTPGNTFPKPAYTVVDQTPVIREKPYLYVDGSGNFAVFVPALQHNTRGVSWANGPTPGTSIPISQFHVAQPSTDTAATLNAALAAGKNILFTPGTYALDDALKVKKANTILLGLGVPSLKAMTGHPVVSVADVDGVTIAGLIIDAGPMDSPELLQIGPDGSSADHSANPTFLYDLTVRTGGPAAGKDDAGIVINSANVGTDDIWIWRADHGNGSGWTSNPSKNGLVVNGNNVTCYGLFNEHHEQYQTLWNGNGGRVYMYQSEIPYDVPNQPAWMDGKVNGYASYKVADNVTSHEAWGLGIYCYFREAAAKLDSAIEVPAAPGVKLHHLTTVWLNG
jgi:predicted heme/steroid binding protein